MSRSPAMLLTSHNAQGGPRYKELSSPRDNSEVQTPYSKEAVVTAR